jgi:hypothetical protein
MCVEMESSRYKQNLKGSDDDEHSELLGFWTETLVPNTS